MSVLPFITSLVHQTIISYRKIVIGILVSASLMLSCSKEDPSKTDPDNGHLKYIGFTLIDTWWDDPTDYEEKVNYH